MIKRTNRTNEQLRDLNFEIDIIDHTEGSVQLTMGKTKVLCTASVDEHVPKWRGDHGWLSAEYSMLPRSTATRINRDRALNSGRSQEISRLIGRSLRSCLDLNELGPRQIIIDCDVIQADGGTRTACINAGFLALALALKFLLDQNIIKKNPLKHYLCAISLGLRDHIALLDLDYKEDVSADVDINVVMNSKGEFIEIQGTGEKRGFSKEQLDQLLKIAQKSSLKIFEKQAQFLNSFFPL